MEPPIEYINLPKTQHAAEFSLMSYNILADCYCLSSYFPYAQHCNLASTNRFPRIIQEIKSLNTDIICLQGNNVISRLTISKIHSKSHLLNSDIRQSTPRREEDGKTVCLLGTRTPYLKPRMSPFQISIRFLINHHLKKGISALLSKWSINSQATVFYWHAFIYITSHYSLICRVPIFSRKYAQ